MKAMVVLEKKEDNIQQTIVTGNAIPPQVSNPA